MKNILLLCIFVSLQLSIDSSVFAEEVLNVPKLASSSGAARQIIEEVIHPVMVNQYEKPWVIPMVTTDIRSSPEFVLAAYISALKNGQYERALSLWDKRSQTLIIEADIADKKTKNDWLREWKSKYSGSNFLLRERVSYGKRYVLLPYYRLDTTDSSLSKWIETISLKNEKNEWYLTLDLAGTPVPGNWMKNGVRVQKPSDFIYMQ